MKFYNPGNKTFETDFNSILDVITDKLFVGLIYKENYTATSDLQIGSNN